MQTDPLGHGGPIAVFLTMVKGCKHIESCKRRGLRRGSLCTLTEVLLRAWHCSVNRLGDL